MAAPPNPPTPSPRAYDVFVSAKGIANGQAKVANAGCHFGIDTPGTTTSGIQEALDFLLSRKKGPGMKVPHGGRLIVTGDAVIKDTIKIPIWPGLHFEAEHIVAGMQSGDAILVGHDYAEVASVIIGGASIRVGILDGPFGGNRTPGALPGYNPEGVTGVHVRQLDGGRIDLGLVRFFTRYGLFLDGYDATDAHAACTDSIYLVDTMTSNGIGLRTKSNSSPQGSFTGGNRMILGHLLGNFIGISIDADTDARATMTPTQPTSINNHIFATVEDSTSLKLNPPATEACDVYLNGTCNLYFLNAKVTRLKGDQNYLVMPGVETLHRYNPSDNNIVHAPTLQYSGFTKLPANPLVPGAVYQNLSGLALEIYVPVTFRGPGRFQASLGSVKEQMVQLPADVVPPGAPPGMARTFLLRVPPGWYYSFSVSQADLGFALALASQA
jgi:hypothetical protein